MLVPQSVVTAGAADLSTAEPVYQVNGLEVTEPQEVSESSADVLDLEHGTVNIRYRMASENSGLTALYTVSQRSADTTYAAFYVKNDTVGLELRSASNWHNACAIDEVSVYEE